MEGIALICLSKVRFYQWCHVSFGEITNYRWVSFFSPRSCENWDIKDKTTLAIAKMILHATHEE